MPYIAKEARGPIDKLSYEICDQVRSPGDLNYAITSLILEYRLRHPTNYQTLNEIIGVLESAKMEFYRRVVAPYENEKIKENGDVYP